MDMKYVKILLSLVLVSFLVAISIFLIRRNNHENSNDQGSLASHITSTMDTTTSLQGEQSQLEEVSYQTTYEGQDYTKSAQVYLPPSYQEDSAMNIFYLMHGSGMNNVDFAHRMQGLFDNWISEGLMEPILVVFPTYYPDRTFMVADYSEDYPLNHYFATTEIREVMEVVEGQFSTFAPGISEADLRASRIHRAFGGYSMGGITTWDVLVEQSPYFYYYLPMAGDSWIDRINNQSNNDETAQTLVSGLEENNYTSADFQIIAMVGENDGTKNSMIPQIEALRRNHPELITDKNLLYWENSNGGHNQQSLEEEVEHGMAYLFGNNQ